MLHGFAEDLVALGNEAPSVVSQIVSILRTVKPMLPTVQKVVQDPAFNTVIARIKTLHEIEASKPATSAPGIPASTAPVGINLAAFVWPLDALIYARRNPWAPWAVGAGILLVIGGIGYRMGQRSK